MNVLLNLGIGILMGSIICAIITALIKDFKRLSISFACMVIGTTFIAIVVLATGPLWYFIISLVCIIYFVFMAVHKYYQAKEFSKGGETDEN